MEYTYIQFASAVTEQKDLFGSLGINWTLLAMQTIAFIVLLAILKRFVYPPLVAMLDKRDAQIAEATKAAVEAEKHAEEAEKRTAQLLAEARKEAGEIVETAKNEATSMVESADKKAKNNAERIVAKAQEDIDKEITHARKSLHNEMVDLVAMATEKVTSRVVDAKTDAKIIEKALGDSK